MKTLDIAQVAKKTGLPASTLRFYEEKGLIKSCGRSGLRRIFEADILEQLSLVSLGRNAGLSLDEIASMMTPNGPKIDRQLLAEKADEIDKQITELSKIRDGLRHASVCYAPDHLNCPKFRRFLNIATKTRVKRRTA